jgi:ribosomal protein L1
MKDEEISQNLMAVLKVLENKLPKGLGNIKAAYVKLTMGKPALIGGSKIQEDSGGGEE